VGAQGSRFATSPPNPPEMASKWQPLSTRHGVTRLPATCGPRSRCPSTARIRPRWGRRRSHRHRDPAVPECRFPAGVFFPEDETRVEGLRLEDEAPRPQAHGVAVQRERESARARGSRPRVSRHTAPGRRGHLTRRGEGNDWPGLGVQPPTVAHHLRDGGDLAGVWSPRPTGARRPRFSGVGPATSHTDNPHKTGTYSTGAILAWQDRHAASPRPRAR
jgi:hypothetical protein